MTLTKDQNLNGDGETAGVPSRTALYRYFDEQDVLLYVGISAHLSDRTRAHERSSPWIACAIRSTIKHYASLAEARTAEIDAIRGEYPLFNVADNDTPEAAARRQRYIDAHPHAFEIREVTTKMQRSLAENRLRAEDVKWEAAERRAQSLAPVVQCPAGHTYKCDTCFRMHTYEFLESANV